MRLAISGPLTDEVLAFGRQIGAIDYVGGDRRPVAGAGLLRLPGADDRPQPRRGRGPEVDGVRHPRGVDEQDQAGAAGPGRADHELVQDHREHGSGRRAGHLLLLLAAQLHRPLRPAHLTQHAGQGRREGDQFRPRSDQVRHAGLLGSAGRPVAGGDRPAGLGQRHLVPGEGHPGRRGRRRQAGPPSGRPAGVPHRRRRAGVPRITPR